MNNFLHEQTRRKRDLSMCYEIEHYLNDTFDPGEFRNVATQERLCELTDAWMSSGFQIDSDIFKPLKREVEVDANRRGVVLSQRDSHTPPELIRSRRGWFFGVSYKIQMELGRIDAAELFVEFITGPFWDGLRKCKYCGRFFITTNGHNKVYCSRTCRALKKRRKHEREEKIRKVKAALVKFGRTPRENLSWKRFVSDKTGIDQRFITRAANAGEVEVPGNRSEKP